MDIEGSEFQPTRLYYQSDPLYPTNRLLMAITHSYAINNSIPKAIRLDDFVAYQYNITISQDVWSELLERTFVLTSRKGSNPPDGQIPRIAVANIWETMTSEPYNIQPTMKMYNYLITSLIGRQSYGQAQARMVEAFQYQYSDILGLTTRVNNFNRSDTDETPLHVLGQRARDLSYHQLRVKLNRQYIRRWVRLLIHRCSKGMRRPEEFSTINMPNIIRDWAPFPPDIVKYRTETGLVELKSESRLINRITQEKRMERNKQSIKFQFDWTRHRWKTDDMPSASGSRLSSLRGRRKVEKSTRFRGTGQS